MKDSIVNGLNGVGVWLRFITPVTVGVVGFLTIYLINGIDFKITRLETHFVNHLQHHQDLEVGYERRITSIEGNRFTNQDGIALETKIMSQLPPSWLIKKVEKNENTIDKLKEYHKVR